MLDPGKVTHPVDGVPRERGCRAFFPVRSFRRSRFNRHARGGERIKLLRDLPRGGLREADRRDKRSDAEHRSDERDDES